MELNEIKERVLASEYVYSQHAEIKRKKLNLTFGQIKQALLNSQLLEQYPDTGRGESCLMTGFADNLPIHVVCGWLGEQIVIVTVYIPEPPKFIDPFTRSAKP